MSSLTISSLEPDAEEELRRRAAEHGRSMQDEARNILQGALGGAKPKGEMDLYAYIRSLVEPIGGVDDLVVPMRDIGAVRPASTTDMDA